MNEHLGWCPACRCNLNFSPEKRVADIVNNCMRLAHELLEAKNRVEFLEKKNKELKETIKYYEGRV